jgi:hypothetical protein
MTGGLKAQKYHLIRVIALKKIKLFLKMIDNLTLTILLCLNPFKDPLSSFVLKVRASFF